MDKENSKELIVVREGFFDKLKKFLKKLFSKKDNIQEDEIQNEEKDDSFKNRVKIEEDSEGQRLRKLQNLINDEEITEAELPNEDIKALHELYDTQILELKKSIDEYREKILKLRMNIKE